MLFDQKTFWLPKDIGDENAYQDASEVDGQQGLAAIADGVSSSMFAGKWARIVVRALIQDPPRLSDDSFRDWLEKRQTDWRGQIDDRALAWHQKPKMRDGAATTLLWIRVSPPVGDAISASAPLRLQCFALGDCCLFHVRANQVQRAFPLEQSQLYDNDPIVLRSVTTREDDGAEFDTLEDICFPGDLLVLCTDAVAVWALTQLERGQPMDFDGFWDQTTEQWKHWIVSLREQGAIRYDDSTMVLLRVRQSRDVA